MFEDPRELSIPELLRRMADQVTTLVRKELELARAEIRDGLRPLIAAAPLIGAAALFGLAAFAALTTAVIAAFALIVPVWAAGLIVMAIFGAAAAALLLAGLRLARSANPVPTQTIETTKEDIEWIRTRGQSARR